MAVFGAARANLGHLLVAVLVLGAFSHTVGQGFSSQRTGWFLVSGIIGMGLGDLALYTAVPFLGSRLTVNRRDRVHRADPRELTPKRLAGFGAARRARVSARALLRRVKKHPESAARYPSAPHGIRKPAATRD